MGGKCECYYCYNVNRGSGNTSDFYDIYGHHDYVGVSNNLVPPVWKNRAKVWMVGDKIHREYDFAVIIKRKYFAHYRLGLKLPNGETNIELIYNNCAEDAVLSDRVDVYNGDEIEYYGLDFSRRILRWNY
jgi:hypothetical protein